MSWQRELANAVTSVDELCRLLQLNPAHLKLAAGAGLNFKLKVPRGFVERMEIGNPRDPLLLQVLPGYQEDYTVPGYSEDPLGEAAANPCNGLLHKYHGRVLLTLTGACAINCRYCFRRHFPYAANNSLNNSAAISEYIISNPGVNEVILSGGDPLLLSDRYLSKVFTWLNELPQIVRLRIHTRIPIVLPSRINNDFIALLHTLKIKLVVVIHANHPQELNAEVSAALARLQPIVRTVLNQSVLLKGVNDDLATLVALSEALFRAGVMPYYLHYLDKVQGAAHFAVSKRKARQLHAALRNSLSGYLVPSLVHEVSGAKSKVLI